MKDEEKASIYYISFAEPGKFLGATVVEAMSELDAIKVAHDYGINPSGQAVCIPVPSHLTHYAKFFELAKIPKLMNESEAHAFDDSTAEPAS